MPRQRGKKWLGDVYREENGEVKRYRIAFETKQQAEAFEADPEAYFAPKLTLEEAFWAGYNYIWLRQKNARDQKYNVTDLIKRFGPKSDPAAINVARITDVIEAWKIEGLSDKRINRKLSCLRQLLSHCRDKGHIQFVPEFTGFKETKGRIRYLTKREAEVIRSHLSQQKHKRFFDFLLYVGCRMGEALGLRWMDCEFDDRVSFWERKGGCPGTIPMVSKAAQALDRDNGLDGPWRDIDYDTFHADFTRAKGLANLAHDDQVVPHVLRHTCCSWLVQRGADIRIVKDWMGHAKIETTMLYAHLAPNNLFGIAKLLDPAFRTVVDSGEETGETSARNEEGTAQKRKENVVPNFVPTVPKLDTDEREQSSGKLLKKIGFS